MVNLYGNIQNFMLSYIQYQIKREIIMEQIGIITKPQGINGEFRARMNISKSEISELKEISINHTMYKVKKVTFREGFVIFSVDGITDCNQVERLRNTPIFAEINHDLEEGEVLISDIIGFDVVLSDGQKLGTLTSIDDYGASQIYTVKSGGKEIMFPNARGVILDFNMADKKIVLDKNILEEIRTDN